LKELDSGEKKENYKIINGREREKRLESREINNFRWILLITAAAVDAATILLLRFILWGKVEQIDLNSFKYAVVMMWEFSRCFVQFFGAYEL
jgi:hypothetical protein